MTHPIIDQQITFLYTGDSAQTARFYYDIYHCFLRDPNGYLLEIQRFNDPSWSQPLEQSKGEDSGRL